MLKLYAYSLAFLIVLIPSILIINNKINTKVNNPENIHKIVIIGSGAAGLSGAIYASRAKLNPVVIEGETTGGQLTKASYIENWPGINSIFGADLVKNIYDHAKELGTQFISSYVTKVDFSKQPFTIWTNEDKKLLASSVVIATGTKPTKLNCPGEEKYLGKGIAVCATCDAPSPLYKGKNIIVIGGDYTALREIAIISKYTDKITVINKKPALNGPLSLLNKVIENPNIKVINNCVAQEIQGNGEWITGVQVFNKTNNKREIIPAEGIFVEIGWEPVTEIFEDFIELDNKGRIKTHDNTKTSVEGIFAAGDVTDNTYHQAPTASSFGYMAAMDAEKYITK